METCGILLAIPFGFFASIAYSYFATYVLVEQVQYKRILLRCSLGILIAFSLEIALVGGIGILRSRQILGPLFMVVHNVTFFLSTPAFANVILLPDRYRYKPHWLIVAFVCFGIAMFDLFYNINVHETLYGVDD